ncbi:MAG TPA: 2-C-methyl-D-erythritol 4-phosphate cytidylyltransferase [Clostridiaceae bacterium]|nr:2-C-methyl-D-erythritol 4-phosphate cytidylyltransferase [Clostridiaceae bacterium]
MNGPKNTSVIGIGNLSTDVKVANTTQSTAELVTQGHRVCALIPAAGRGQRMGADGNKLFMQLAGKTILERTLDVFERHPRVTDICLITTPAEIDKVRSLIKKNHFQKINFLAFGGETRGQSVANGLKTLANESAQNDPMTDLIAASKPFAANDFVLVHDGARCLITADVIDRCITGARIHGAVVAGVPVKDTIKFVDVEECVTGTPNRSELRQIQTPQAFRFGLLYDAYTKHFAELTDDAAVVEASGHPVHIVPGDERNIKITTPLDLAIAEQFLR